MRHRNMARSVVVALAAGCAAVTVWAAQSEPADACEAAAQAKKLAGAAKTSFVKKCQQDAQARCEAQAGEKKLAGAAKNSFVAKCVRDGGPQAQ